MQFYTASDRGKIRETNEDSCLAKEISGYTLLVLADGMGGHRGGEIASKKAIEVISDSLEKSLRPKMIPGQIMLLLSQTLESANQKIISLTKENEELEGMGTTCDICLVSKNTAYIAHVGDSRVYKISKKNQSISLLTKDHSLVEYMVDNGTITREESVHHPQKNIILQALGTSEDINVDISHVKLSSDDVILMCSDGLTNMIEEDDITNIISSENTPESAAGKLVQLANDAGGIDNITVVVAMN